MNQTKKVMIIIAIIFSFADTAWNIYDIVKYFMAEPQYRPAVFYVVFMFFELFATIAIGVLLILAIWKNGTLFRQRYGYYMSALIISIILNLFSITSVLLIITMFLSDWVWIKPDKIETIKDSASSTKEEQITRLRERHANGELSDEEFQEELTKLL